MKRIRTFIVSSIVAGFLIVVPLYLAMLLLLKAMASLGGSFGPSPACCAAVRTRAGRRIRERAETSLFDRIPGYGVIRSLTLQMVGQGQENVWKPAFVEIEDALVPSFIIEEHEDGRFTVFVPSVPTRSQVRSMCWPGSGCTRSRSRSPRR
jgi:hypothetical protein